jgi:CBS domain containing-hemolysin-like protein
MLSLPWLLLLLFTLAISFSLSGLESALHSISRVRLRHAAGAGDFRAQRLLPLIEDRDALLGAITVTNHVSNLLAFTLITLKALALHGPWQYLLAFVCSLPLFLIGLEALPKKIFRNYPFRCMRALLPLLQMVGWFRPLFRLFAKSKTGSAAAGQIADEGKTQRTDLHQQAQELSHQQQLSAPAAHLIQHLLSHTRLTAGEVMRPLRDSLALAPDMPLHQARIIAQQHQQTALPVLGEKALFQGVLDLTTLPANLPTDRLVRQHTRTLEQVSSQENILHVLRRLRKSGRSLCLVIKDHEQPQQPVGLIHEEDLLRQLIHCP